MKSIAKCAPVLALLLATAANAQTSNAPASPSAPNPPSASDSMSRTNPQTTTAPASRSSVAAMDWRASKLIGAAVYNQANERIGDINELLLDDSGKVAHVVLGVGGFLGMGERQVAVPFNDLKLTQDGSSIKIMAAFNKQALSSMPEWRDDRVGGSSSAPNRPAGSTTAPAPQTNAPAPQNR